MHLTVNGQIARLSGDKLMVSGTAECYTMTFEFDESWNGLFKVAVFESDKTEPKEVIINSDNTCMVPWEALQYPAKRFRIGVYGTRDSIRYPTVYADAVILEGTAQGTPSLAPTPSLYDQIVALTEQAVEAAQSVRQDADEGKFDGNDYILTADDKQEISTLIKTEYDAISLALYYDLVSVLIPSDITSIGENTFRICRKLKMIIFEAVPAFIHEKAFENCSNLEYIYVPWSEGEVSGAPWGAANARIEYNYEPPVIYTAGDIVNGRSADKIDSLHDLINGNIKLAKLYDEYARFESDAAGTASTTYDRAIIKSDDVVLKNHPYVVMAYRTNIAADEVNVNIITNQCENGDEKVFGHNKRYSDGQIHIAVHQYNGENDRPHYAKAMGVYTPIYYKSEAVMKTEDYFDIQYIGFFRNKREFDFFNYKKFILER